MVLNPIHQFTEIDPACTTGPPTLIETLGDVTIVLSAWKSSLCDQLPASDAMIVVTMNC
jgi:hypothetical protein